MCLIFLDLTKGLQRMKACLFKPLWCFSRGGSHTNLVAFLPAGSEGWAKLPVSSSRRAREETQLAFIWTAFPRRTHGVLPLQSIQVFLFFPWLLIIWYMESLRILTNVWNKMTLLISERRSWFMRSEGNRAGPTAALSHGRHPLWDADDEML